MGVEIEAALNGIPFHFRGTKKSCSCKDLKEMNALNHLARKNEVIITV